MISSREKEGERKSEPESECGKLGGRRPSCGCLEDSDLWEMRTRFGEVVGSI